MGGDAPAAGPQQIAKSLLPFVQKTQSNSALQEFIRLLPRMEALCIQYLWRALQELGFKTREHQRFTTASQAHDLRILERYHRLLGRIFQMFEEDGYLARQGQNWTISAMPSARDPES